MIDFFVLRSHPRPKEESRLVMAAIMPVAVYVHQLGEASLPAHSVQGLCAELQFQISSGIEPETHQELERLLT